jgi:WD40 repeat protein
VIVAAIVLAAPAPLSALNITKVGTSPGVRPIALAAAPRGSLFVAALEDGSVRIIDARNRQTVKQMPKHPQPAYGLDWSADGAWIVSGDESARVWISDVRTGKRVREYRTHTRGIQKASFDRARKFLVTTGRDDQLNIYNLTAPQPKEERKILGKGANVYGAAFHPQNPGLIVTGILSAAVRGYDSRTGLLRGIGNTATNQGVYDVEFNKLGNRFATAGRDGTVAIFATSNYKPLATLRGHQDWVIDVAWSPNGKLIASSSTDRTVRFWNAGNFQRVAVWEEMSGVGSPVIFTADARYVVAVDIAGSLVVGSLEPGQG